MEMVAYIMVHPLGAIQQHIMKIIQHTVMIISLQEMDIGLLDGTQNLMVVVNHLLLLLQTMVHYVTLAKR